MRLRPLAPWASAVLFAAAAFAQDANLAPAAHGWTLPLFTKEGYRQMTLRGDEIQQVSANRVDITGMTVTVFSGDAAAKVDSVLMSPAATFLTGERIAKGDGPVRLVRDDIEVSGKGWTYLYDQKKVLILSHAHVVFHASLPDILK
ncbi:MAG TPA: hypothetical protein VGG37_06300 [Opitutaceae bacterium]|jgi:hypothetical protein